MSFENIRQTVMKASDNEAQRIISAAKKQVEQQLVAQKNTAHEESERIYEARARAIDEEYARKLIQVKGKAGKEFLEKRNAMLREVFTIARQTILDWPNNEYKAVMQHLIEQAVGKTGGVLRVHPEDAALFLGLIDELNRHREPVNQLQIDSDRFLVERGGFVFIGAEFEIDQTLMTIMDEIERELLPAIAKELFPE
jgi:vacuolar-type H+-ATPase subunit E/Vma4